MVSVTVCLPFLQDLSLAANIGLLFPLFVPNCVVLGTHSTLARRWLKCGEVHEIVPFSMTGN